MHALVSRSGDLAPRWEQVERRPLRPDDVRVEVAAAGYTYFDGFVAADHETLGLPDVIGLGFDFAGTVTEIGTDVTSPSVGTRVAGFHSDAAAAARAHVSEVVVPASDVAVVPGNLPLEHAAAIPLNALAARQALDTLGARRGSLLVTGGAGQVGTWTIGLAARDGRAVDALVRPGTAHLAREAGAPTVHTNVPRRGYDAVLDAAALQDSALTAGRDGGRFVGVKPGRPVTPKRGVVVATVLTRPDGTALAELLTLAARGVVPVRIAATRPMRDAAAGPVRAADDTGSCLRSRSRSLSDRPVQGRRVRVLRPTLDRAGFVKPFVPIRLTKRPACLLAQRPAS